MTPRRLAAASDALLAERAGDGDTAAFEALARRHGPLMRAYARRLTGSLADADDVVQEALMHCWSQLPALRDPAAVRGWMMRITARCAINVLRRRTYDTALDEETRAAADPAPGPESAAVTVSSMTALATALGRLPEVQRQCWVLRKMGGQSCEEISRTLGISTESVRGRLARARTTLIKEMEAWR
ncbi:sigma-70 family RNA polymerase sigma factor [Arthrobacter sp. UYEF20]|uniref:RNA polymerase sigma factor n=1 Tax=Arthrobacter sp. UYEF20 TaxID=1756363 RepID=UPI00339952A0